MTRIAKKTIVSVSQADAQAAAHAYAKASINKDKLKAEMDAKLATIREKYEPEITGYDEEMNEQVETLEAFAKENRNNWDGKSIELANCTIGFRTNPPSVGKKKGITWDAVVGLFKANKLLKGFVKVKEDVDKAALLKQQSDIKLMKQLEAVGVTIEQEEQFYVDAKKES